MTDPNKAQHDALAHLERADNNWHQALVSAFGTECGNARYDQRGRGEDGSPIRALYDARVAAFHAWKNQ